MKLTPAFTSALLAIFLTLHGCAAPSETSENYRRLNAQTLDKVTEGMTKADALKLLGNPWTVITYRGKPNETYLNWYWRANVNDAMIFSAVMDTDNKVIRTERWLDPNDPQNLSADTRE